MIATDLRGSPGRALFAKVFCLGIVAAGMAAHPASAVEDSAPRGALSRPQPAQPAVRGAFGGESRDALRRPRRANFEREPASRDAKHIADWAVDSGDNRRMPFMIVDKVEAKVFVFDADGKLRGAAPALLGLARGDDSVPGIGERALANIRPEERTTPAGRFVAALGRNLKDKDILWVDYDTAISLHRVVTGKPAERRAQRLATPSALDNRISYGCINVPAAFYDRVVSPAFTGTEGIVYVLPETRSLKAVFASYDVGDAPRVDAARRAVRARAPDSTAYAISE
jgi:hypothetical protein